MPITRFKEVFDNLPHFAVQFEYCIIFLGAFHSINFMLKILSYFAS